MPAVFPCTCLYLWSFACCWIGTDGDPDLLGGSGQTLPSHSEWRGKIVADSAAAIPDETGLEAYEQNKSEMVLPMFLHLKHISIRGYANDDAARKAGLAKANMALDKIYAGQVFDRVAEEFSELMDPENGCDLGMVPIGSLPVFMAKAAVPLEIGDVSDYSLKLSCGRRASAGRRR